MDMCADRNKDTFKVFLGFEILGNGVDSALENFLLFLTKKFFGHCKIRLKCLLSKLP